MLVKLSPDVQVWAKMALKFYHPFWSSIFFNNTIFLYHIFMTSVIIKDQKLFFKATFAPKQLVKLNRELETNLNGMKRLQWSRSPMPCQEMLLSGSLIWWSFYLLMLMIFLTFSKYQILERAIQSIINYIYFCYFC